jgi:hypothetical protein
MMEDGIVDTLKDIRFRTMGYFPRMVYKAGAEWPDGTLIFG